MANCILTGTILYSDGSPVESALIYAVPAVSPAISSTGYGIVPYPIQIYTSSSGDFSLELMRNVEFFITIPTLGFREKVRVPDTSTVSFFSLTSLPINNEPVDPPNPNW